VDGCLAVALDLRFHPLQVCPDAGALIVHVTLALSAAWQRRLLKLLTAEALQGITVPLLPAEQLTNTRVATAFCGGILVTMGAYRPRSGTVVPSTAFCRSPCNWPPARTLHRTAILDALVAMV
jgi:hypothetical protein